MSATAPGLPATSELLSRLEAYYDAVPRAGARAENFGPLTLFVREGDGWPLYARPTLGWTGEVTAADVSAVRQRQRDLGVPENLEWVDETTPSLRAAAEAAGLAVTAHPLMVFTSEAPPPAAAVPEGWSVRLLSAEDPLLPAAAAVAELAFAEPGTAIGVADAQRLADAARDDATCQSAQRLAARIRAGLTVLVAAVRDGTVGCTGQHQPLGGTTEIVGVGTLPAVRRRGLGLAVTRELIADAAARGVTTVFLSAGDDDVARIYGRGGFARVATALIAAPAP